ncbi:apoptosis-resistant E3 ubiquitin protein ligase 1 isoform X1 [Haemaphysalis longicornis]
MERRSGASQENGTVVTFVSHPSIWLAARLPQTLLCALATFALTYVALHQGDEVIRDQWRAEAVGWLDSIGLGSHKELILSHGCDSLPSCASLAFPLSSSPSSPSPGDDGVAASLERLLSGDAYDALRLASGRLRSRLVLERWLRDHHLVGAGRRRRHSAAASSSASSPKAPPASPPEGESSPQRFDAAAFSSEWPTSEQGPIGSLEELVWQVRSGANGGKEGWRPEVVHAVGLLPRSPEAVRAVTGRVWEQVLVDHQQETWAFGALVGVSLVASVLVGVASLMLAPAGFLCDQSAAAAAKLGFLGYLTGKYLSPASCRVEFDWTEPQVVGSTLTFFIKFFQRNGRGYPICDEDPLLVEVVAGNGVHKVACSVELGGTDPALANQARVQFTVRRAGLCHVSVLVGMVHVRGSPFVKSFLPGRPDPQKTGFIHHSCTVVCTQDEPHHLFLEPRDKYNNACIVDPSTDPSDEYSVDIIEVSSGRPVTSPCYHWDNHPENSRIALVLRLDQAGCYQVSVSYRGTSLSNGDFHVIVLSKSDASLVRKNVAKKSHNIWYEAKLVGLNSEKLAKPKKVFVYISPKQLTVKEYMLRIIPKRLITFRLCPSTKFQFKGSNNHDGEPVLVIDDGCQSQVEMICEERDVIAATFTQFLLKNIGGSETFKDKLEFFHYEVRKLHQKHYHDKLQLKVSRDKILESSMKATKNLSTSDWCKSFEITFMGEQGLDWGGLRREWFEVLCSALFDPENQLFHRFKNDKQGLVHPNPRRPSHLKLKHYEYAGRIVSKCLYESSLGSGYRQLVRARFSRSFLAQLIGLRVHYKYFEQDDPDLYVTKIKYILENDMDDMELYFCEEEYTSSGQLLKTTELIPGGSKIRVTNQNKLQYLDALAQYRLATSVREEVEYFLKGLNELIPENLLCIFDENELELLMCGTGQFSIADFKANHSVSGFSIEFRKVLDWFWTAVSNFTEEEMARLLQFTTGCSQLPPGGFAELNPRFHLSAAPTFGSLPTAHTCFNQLCLPDYDSYEQFERALRLSINEGTEGFGMI